MFLSRCGAFLTLKAFVVTSLVPSFLFATGPNRDDNDLKITAVYKAGQAPHQPSLFEECQQLAGGGANGSTTPVVASVPRASVVVKQEPGTDEDLAAAVTNGLFAGAFNAGPAMPTHMPADVASSATSAQPMPLFQATLSHTFEGSPATTQAIAFGATPENASDATPDATAAQPFLTVDYNAFGPGAPPAPKTVSKTPARASKKRSLVQTEETPQQPGQPKKQRLTQKKLTTKGKGKAPLYKRTYPYATRSSQTASQTSTHKPQPAVQAVATPMDVDAAETSKAGSNTDQPPVSSSDESDSEAASTPSDAANQTPGEAFQLSDEQRKALQTAQAFAKTGLRVRPFVASSHLTFGLLPGHKLTQEQKKLLEKFQKKITITRRGKGKPSTHIDGASNEVASFFDLFVLKAYFHYFGRSLPKNGSFDEADRLICKPFLKAGTSVSCHPFFRSFVSLCESQNATTRGCKGLRTAFYKKEVNNTLQNMYDLLQKNGWQEQVAAMQANHPRPPVSCLPNLEPFDDTTHWQIQHSLQERGLHSLKGDIEQWDADAYVVLQFMKQHNKDLKFAGDNKKLCGWLRDLCGADVLFSVRAKPYMDSNFHKLLKTFVLWCFLSQAGVLPAADVPLSEAQNAHIQKGIANLLAPFLDTAGHAYQKGTDHSIRFWPIYKCFKSANRLQPTSAQGSDGLLEWLKEKDFFVDRSQDLLSVEQEILLRRCTSSMGSLSGYRSIPQLHLKFNTLGGHDLTGAQKAHLAKLQSDAAHHFTIESTEKMQEVSHVKPEVQQLFNFYLLDAYLRKFDRTLSGVIALEELDDNTQSVLAPLWKKDAQGIIRDIALASMFVYAYSDQDSGDKQPCYPGLVAVDWQEQVAAMQKPCPTLSVNRPLSLELFDEQTKQNIFQAKLPWSLQQNFQWGLHGCLRNFMEQKRKRFQLPQQIENLCQWLKDLGFGSDFLFFTNCDAYLQGVEDKLQAIVLTCMLGQYGVLLAPGIKDLKPLKNKEKCKEASEFLAHFVRPCKKCVYLDFKTLFASFLSGNQINILWKDHIESDLMPWLEAHGFLVDKPAAAQPPVAQAAALNAQAAPVASTAAPVQITAAQKAVWKGVQDRARSAHLHFVTFTTQQQYKQQAEQLKAELSGVLTPQVLQILQKELDLLNSVLQKRSFVLTYPSLERQSFFYAQQNPDGFHKIHLQHPTTGQTTWLKERWPEIFEGTLLLEDVSKLDFYLVNELCAMPGVKKLVVSTNKPYCREAINVASDVLEQLVLKNTMLKSASLGLCPQLTKFSLKGGRLWGESSKSLPSLANLQTICLDACNVDEETLLWIARQPALTRLTLKNVLRSGAVRQLEWLEGIPHLTCLDLFDNALQPDDFKGLRHLKQLRLFQTAGGFLDREVIEAIVQNNQLHQLSLLASGLTRQSITPLAQAVSAGELPRLKVLLLSCNKLCAKDVKFIEQMPLSSLGLADVAQGYRLLPLLNYRHLLELTLKNTGLIAEDIQLLCQGIKKGIEQNPLPTKVRHLDLRDNPLQLSALGHLMDLWRSPGFNGRILVLNALISSKEADGFNKACATLRAQAKQQGRTLQPFEVSAGYWPAKRLAEVKCEMQNGTGLVVRTISAPEVFKPTPSAAVAEAAQAPDNAVGPAPMDEE